MTNLLYLQFISLVDQTTKLNYRENKTESRFVEYIQLGVFLPFILCLDGAWSYLVYNRIYWREHTFFMSNFKTNKKEKDGEEYIVLC